MENAPDVGSLFSRKRSAPRTGYQPRLSQAGKPAARHNSRRLFTYVGVALAAGVAFGIGYSVISSGALHVSFGSEPARVTQSHRTQPANYSIASENPQLAPAHVDRPTPLSPLANSDDIFRAIKGMQVTVAQLVDEVQINRDMLNKLSSAMTKTKADQVKLGNSMATFGDAALKVKEVLPAMKARIDNVEESILDLNRKLATLADNDAPRRSADREVGLDQASSATASLPPSMDPDQ